jgi:eukaryotic-like serine/threonine-protein kinase
MTADRWHQIESLFEQAIQCPLPARQAFLNRVCQGDDELRRELESLLACDAPDQRLVEIPDAGAAPADGGADLDMSGRRIGPYQLIRLLGHGGMGSVYLGARNDDQFRKQVAIKLLKRGMDTEFMLNRFRQERQILANLEHPFISRLLDGGATGDGLPYFVMEYVDGVPITDYCSGRNLSLPERLRLFRLVCEAVQYAHQNLVVHRDIKPSNILTTKEGIPKLLDFGIAKVLNPDFPVGATLTQRELRMLTPDYASPEQVKGLQISTASDIYSLGAVLYELLSGQRPHRFPSSSLGDMERTICETETERPSLAAARREGLSSNLRQQLRRQISGDLDNIALTALRKEPQRRYASAAELSEDVRRHLEALPILAQADHFGYRAGKFIRRNRLAVAAALLVVASLVGGIVATTIQARRAERRFQIVRDLANTVLFDLHDEMERLPGSTALRAATIRTVVRYLDALARDGPQDPRLDLEIATAYERIGTLEGHPFNSNLGGGPAALRNYEKALAIFERLANRSEFRGQAIRGLIDTHLHVRGMESLLGNPEAAAAHLRKASGIAAAFFDRGDPGMYPGTQIRLYLAMADSEYNHGDARGELAYYLKALEISQRWAAADHSAEAIGQLREAYRNVGSAQARSGDLAGARESFRSAQGAADELLRRAGVKQDLHFNSISVYTTLGDILAAPDDPNFGDRTGALAQYGKALEMAERLAASDPKNVNAHRLVATCYQRLGMMWAGEKPAQAVEYFGKALSISQSLGAGDPRNAEYRYHASRAHLGLGEAFHNLGRHDEAVQNLNRAVALQKAILAVSPERIFNLRVLSRAYALMGVAMLGQGNPGQALGALQEGLAVADRMLERAPASLYHQLDRADVLEALGGYYVTLARQPGVASARRAECKAEARAWFEKSLAIWKDWNARKVAAPYAVRRMSQVMAMMGSIDRP